MEKSIYQYEDFYRITDSGDVYSEERIVYRKGFDKAGNPMPPITVKAKKLKNYKAKNGYYVVNLCKGYSCKQRYVHELVANAFIGERPKKNTINHKDGNKLNNHVSNLEYVTYAVNNEHARLTGLNNVVIADYTIRKPVVMYNLDGDLLKRFHTVQDAKMETGAAHITCVCKGKRKTSGGYIWKYDEKNI